jgi:hypothetical protein
MKCGSDSRHYHSVLSVPWNEKWKLQDKVKNILRLRMKLSISYFFEEKSRLFSDFLIIFCAGHTQTL